MISLLSGLALASLTGANLAQRPVIDLWPSGNPDGWRRTDEERVEDVANAHFKVVYSVGHPNLQIYRSHSASKSSPFILVCPGGGYAAEAFEHEGIEIAERLNRSGFNAAVLKYRLPLKDEVRYKAPLQDAQRGVRLLRSYCKQEGLADRVGIMGFSAGGHLSAVCSNAESATYDPVDDTDRLSPKPDFSILIYPAYLDTDRKPVLPPEVAVNASTPPAFIVCTLDDDISNVGSLAYDLACINAKVAAELHSFPKGGHGYGLRSKDPDLSQWPNLLVTWLKELG
jgi:acetyl esterase/lipase